MTTEDLQFAREEIEGQLDEIRSQLSSLEGQPPRMIENQLIDINEDIRYVKSSLLKDFSIQIGEIPLDRQEEWKKVLDTLVEGLNSIQAATDRRSSDAKRANLLGHREDSPPRVSEMTAGQKAAAAMDINTETMQVVEGMNRDMEEAIQINEGVAEQLHENQEMMLRINDTLSSMQNDLEISKRLIREFFRSVVSDRISLVLLLLLALVILAVIVFLIIRKFQ